jgi:hypothetical protein
MADSMGAGERERPPMCSEAGGRCELAGVEVSSNEWRRLKIKTGDAGFDQGGGKGWSTYYLGPQHWVGVEEGRGLFCLCTTRLPCKSFATNARRPQTGDAKKGGAPGE